MHKLRQLRCAVLLPSLFRPGLRTREHCFLNVLWGERQACNYIGVSSGLDQPPGWGSRAGSSPSILQPHPIVGEPRGDLATRGAGQFASVEPGVVSDLGQRVGRRAELHHLLVRRELRLGKVEPVEGRGEDVDAHRRNAESGLAKVVARKAGEQLVLGLRQMRVRDQTSFRSTTLTANLLGQFEDLCRAFADPSGHSTQAECRAGEVAVHDLRDPHGTSPGRELGNEEPAFPLDARVFLTVSSDRVPSAHTFTVRAKRNSGYRRWCAAVGRAATSSSLTTGSRSVSMRSPECSRADVYASSGRCMLWKLQVKPSRTAS